MGGITLCRSSWTCSELGALRSLLLSKADLLNGRAATTNKMVFKEVAGLQPKVNWKRKARWVKDGKFYTSSGVSAGMDMTLQIIEELLGLKEAERAAHEAEYHRIRDPDDDPFAAIYNL